MYTVQISDPSLAPADGTNVVWLKTKTAVLNAFEAAYMNTLECETIWGGQLPAMSEEMTVTVWHGRLYDVTDVYPDAEITLSRQRRGTWKNVA